VVTNEGRDGFWSPTRLVEAGPFTIYADGNLPTQHDRSRVRQLRVAEMTAREEQVTQKQSLSTQVNVRTTVNLDNCPGM
jgi:hypothetical protein